MAVRLPTIAPKVKLPAAPQPAKPSMTSFGTYPAGTMIGQLAPLKPMPQAVANNINLGWNYATGQVVQPLTPQQRAQVAIPPIGNLGIKTPTQTVYPTTPVAPKPMPLVPAAQAAQIKNTLGQVVPSKQALASTQQNLLINQFLPKQVASMPGPKAPVRPVPLGRY